MTRLEKLKTFNSEEFTKFLLELCEASFCGEYTEDEYKDGYDYILNWLNSEIEGE